MAVNFYPKNVPANFANSLKTDKRLFRQEIRASIAHCDGLFRAGIATKLETERLKNGLWTILKRADFDPHYFEGIDAPDIFTFIEARLYQLINEAAFQLVIGRSHLHRAATALRLWLREETETIIERFDELQEILQKFPETPVLAALVQGFWRDEGRFREVLRGINKMPCPQSDAADEATAEIDFHHIARELGFASVAENSLDAGRSRDFCLDFSNACTTTILNLARLAEALAHYFINDFERQRVFQKIRGSSAKAIGNHTALLTALNNQPFETPDEQIEVCEIIFETTDILKSGLQIILQQNN